MSQRFDTEELQTNDEKGDWNDQMCGRAAGAFNGDNPSRDGRKIAVDLKVGIVLLKRMGVGEGLTPHSGTPFHADSNEFLFVSIALTFTEILADCDHA